VLNVKGQIYPISNQNVSLHAKMIDGSIIKGESKITEHPLPIKSVYLNPQPVKPLYQAVRALKNAQLIVISPGSLYTSILPNLIIPEIIETLKVTDAKIVYVCNVMTQA